jgi:anti-sigma factor RsiW
MTEARPDEELMLLLNAYLDGELDPIAAQKVEARLAAEPAAARELAELERLRNALRADLADDLPPDTLRRRVEALAAPPLVERAWSWRALAASALIGAVLAGGGTFGLLAGQQGDPLTDAVVASHIRALMAPAPIDVASSDHHTVKPWFDGKLAYAPDVVELETQGFPLVGGRVDVVNFEPVATLVYRAGKHLISLTAIPGAKEEAAPRERDARGFHALAWRGNGVGYVAVSDAAPEEIAAFAEAFRSATARK